MKRSVRTYSDLVLTSQVLARSSIAGNSASAVDAQQLFKDAFKSLINEDLSIDIKKYQGVLEHALSKVDFSVGIGIYMLPRNLNLNIGKKEGYNNKNLVSNTDMKIGSNKDINRDLKKFPVAKPNVARHDPVGGLRRSYNLNLNMLTEKHNDEKLPITFLIIGTGLIAYHFWSKIFTVSGAVVNVLAFSGTNFIFSRFTHHGARERKRHDLAEEKPQRARDEWNKNRIKWIDFINKRLRGKNEARAYIKNVDKAMLEYYRVFA